MKITTVALILFGVAFGGWTLLNLYWLPHEPLVLAIAGLESFGTLVVSAYAEYRSIRCNDRTATVLCTISWGLLGLASFLQLIAVLDVAQASMLLVVSLVTLLSLFLAISHTCWLFGLNQPSPQTSSTDGEPSQTR
jgi:uncharacterized membrane protein YuzA (DUF378 family)